MTPNSAAGREMTRVPRIGMDRARKIVRDGAMRKGFRDRADFANMPGITEANVEAIRTRASIGCSPRIGGPGPAWSDWGHGHGRASCPAWEAEAVWRRIRLIGGLTLIGMGLIGVVVPVIPTVPLLIAGVALAGPDHPLARRLSERLKPLRQRMGKSR